VGKNSVLAQNFWTFLRQFGSRKIFCCPFLNKNVPLPLLFWENLQLSFQQNDFCTPNSVSVKKE